MTGQRRKQAQMGEHSRMNRTEFMRQLESLLQNISATEREEALQYYNEYFNDAGPENEQNVIEALGNPANLPKLDVTNITRSYITKTVLLAASLQKML